MAAGDTWLVRTRGIRSQGADQALPGYVEAQVAGPVAQQMLEILIAGRLPESRADEQVPVPGTAEVEGEEGMQLVPRPGRAGVPAGVAEQAEEHRELAEQGSAGEGQRCLASVAGHVVGDVLPGFGLIHLRAHRLDVGTCVQDDARRLEPLAVVRDPFLAHPDVAGAAEVGAEGLLVAAGQIALFGCGQLEDGLRPPPAAGRAEVGVTPGVEVRLPDTQSMSGSRQTATNARSRAGSRATLPARFEIEGECGRLRARSLAARKSGLP